MYSNNSREQIKKFEFDKFVREEGKAFDDLMTIAIEDPCYDHGHLAPCICCLVSPLNCTVRTYTRFTNKI